MCTHEIHHPKFYRIAYGMIWKEHIYKMSEAMVLPYYYAYSVDWSVLHINIFVYKILTVDLNCSI